MRVQQWVKYLILISLLFVIVFSGQNILESMRKNVEVTYNYNFYFQSIVMFVFYVVIGLVLGLDHLILEIRKEGVWTINTPKIVLMGIPALYFSLGIFLFSSSNTFINSVLGYPISMLFKTGTNFVPIFQLILGYSIVTAVYKKPGRKRFKW